MAGDSSYEDFAGASEIVSLVVKQYYFVAVVDIPGQLGWGK